MNINDRAIVATIAGVIWDDSPVSAGRVEYTVYGWNHPDKADFIGTFDSYRDARQCERSAYHYHMTSVEKSAQFCLLTDKAHMSWYDREAFVNDAIRSNA